MRRIPWTLPLLLWCVAAVAATNFEQVMVYGRDIKAGILVGLGTELSSPLVDAKRNPVQWRVKRDERDTLGMRHVFYEQVVRTPHGQALIRGTDVGFHYAPDGKLRLVAGQQVTSLSIANEARFEIDGAADRIVVALRGSTPSPMTPGEIRALKNPIRIG